MSSEVAINAGKIVTPFYSREKVSIKVRNGIIIDVSDGYVSSGNVLDYRDYIVLPGLLDTHIHGIKGYDVNNGKIDDILGMSKTLVEYGVTGFLPSTVTASHEELVNICRCIKEAYEEWNLNPTPIGARILGLHLEGPYINPEKRGAQNPKFIRKPNIKEIKEYYHASNGLLKMITLAPEIEGCLEIISELTRLGITVSLGHSNASYDITVKAIVRGASRATHLFNAMRGIHHRDPGLIIALLEHPNVYIELIADLIHLHPSILRFVVRHVGSSRVILISDSISATGLSDGVYNLGELEVHVKGGIARLSDGRLAGSTLTLNKALINMVNLGFNLIDVVKMTSFNPARNLGIKGLGDIRPGFYGDFAVLDAEFRVKATIINGAEVYSSRGG